MSKWIGAVLVAVVVGGVGLAGKDVRFTACTADKYVATLPISLNDAALKATPEIESDIQVAFNKVAGTMDFRDLVMEAGYHAFMAALNDQDQAAIDQVSEPVTDGTHCE